MNDKILFELDNIMHEHGCEVRPHTHRDPDTDVVTPGRTYITGSGVCWDVRPSTQYGNGWWHLRMYSSKDNQFPCAANVVDVYRGARKVMVMKAVAHILSEMRRMVEDTVTN